MMINEDTLVLYFYNDGLLSEEREHVRCALEDSEDLRIRYARLSNCMEQLCVPESIAAPAEAAASWRDALDARVSSAKVSQGFFQDTVKQRFALAAATVLVFVAGWWLGGELSSTSAPDLPVQVAEVKSQRPSSDLPAVPKVPVVFVRGVSSHLERAQIQLASLDLGNPGERDALIDQIVSQNRSFLQAADKNGADDVARLLRAFEPLLLELASEEQSSVDKEKARDQLEFEFGITLTKFAWQASNKTNEF